MKTALVVISFVVPELGSLNVPIQPTFAEVASVQHPSAGALSASDHSGQTVSDHSHKAWEVVASNATVANLPVTAESKPFLKSRIDLAVRGYVEEEFIFSGTARSFHWADHAYAIKAAPGSARYATRILVIRPKDPRKFSGNIEVETLNASTGADMTTTMATSGDDLMRRGDVWVGMTSKALTLNALKRFDPVRYAKLQWGNPAPSDQRCAPASIIPVYSFGDMKEQALAAGISKPESEDGLVYEMFAQLGAMLKGTGRGAILPGFAPPRLFATGYSQSGIFQRTFASAFHTALRLSGNRPIFDGYLIEVGPTQMRLNQCADDILPADPRNHVPAIDAPVINIVSEGDMWLGLPTRQEDRRLASSGIITYELAGAAHGHGMGDAGRPTTEELRKAIVPSLPTGNFAKNDYPRGYFSAAALKGLQDWSRGIRVPPSAPPLVFRDGRIARDGDGNALGGLRGPWIDAPLFHYQGSMGQGALAVVGVKASLDVTRLAVLYPGGVSDYLAHFTAALDKTIAARFILASNREAILVAARAQARMAFARTDAGVSN